MLRAVAMHVRVAEEEDDKLYGRADDLLYSLEFNDVSTNAP